MRMKKMLMHCNFPFKWLLCAFFFIHYFLLLFHFMYIVNCAFPGSLSIVKRTLLSILSSPLRLFLRLFCFSKWKYIYIYMYIAIYYPTLCCCLFVHYFHILSHFSLLSPFLPFCHFFFFSLFFNVIQRSS